MSLNIGNNIKKRRLEIGLTQETLSQKLGYKSKSTINKIESGTNDISQSKVIEFAEALNTTPAYLMGLEDEKSTSNGRLVPVLGKVVAGLPLETIEYILDYEGIPSDWVGEYFALQVEGKSMEPKICTGDILIVKKQNYVDSGDTAVILVGNEDATIKKVLKNEKGITLVATNINVYLPTFYSNRDIVDIPVTVLGKVVELRSKF